jgi:hypothetical protein
LFLQLGIRLLWLHHNHHKSSSNSYTLALWLPHYRNLSFSNFFPPPNLFITYNNNKQEPYWSSIWEKKWSWILYGGCRNCAFTYKSMMIFWILFFFFSLLFFLFKIWDEIDFFCSSPSPCWIVLRWFCSWLWWWCKVGDSG